MLILTLILILRYFNLEPSFKVRWCSAQDLLGSQIPMTTGGFELRISCIRSLLHTKSLSNPPTSYARDFVCKRFVVQTLLWSLEFVILVNLEDDTIAVILIWFYVICLALSFSRFFCQPTYARMLFTLFYDAARKAILMRMFVIRDRSQISFLILSEFKRID